MTVTVILSVITPSALSAVTVMVALPLAIPVTTPLLLTVATLVSEELHETLDATEQLLLSRNFAITLSWRVYPTGTVVLVGESVKLVSAVLDTVTVVLVSPLPAVALSVVLAMPEPLLMAVTSPVLLTVATEVLELLHVH